MHYHCAAEASPDAKCIAERLTRAKLLKKKEEREIKAQKRLWCNMFKNGFGDEEVNAATTSRFIWSLAIHRLRQLLRRLLRSMRQSVTVNLIYYM